MSHRPNNNRVLAMEGSSLSGSRRGRLAGWPSGGKRSADDSGPGFRLSAKGHGSRRCSASIVWSPAVLCQYQPPASGSSYTRSRSSPCLLHCPDAGCVPCLFAHPARLSSSSIRTPPPEAAAESSPGLRPRRATYRALLHVPQVSFTYLA